MKYLSSAAVALSLMAALSSAPAAAQSRSADVQCLLVSNLFANQAKDAKAKQLASSAALFYAGRASLLPNAQLQAAMAAQRKQLDLAAAGTLMNSCAQGMTSSMNNLQTVGRSALTAKP